MIKLEMSLKIPKIPRNFPKKSTKNQKMPEMEGPGSAVRVGVCQNLFY